MNTPNLSMTQKAYQEIKSMIMLGKLAPGQIVNEAMMQEKLHLGRTPIHEAFLQLSQDQLVTIIPRKGIQICSISVKQIHDIFEARIFLEPAILEKYADCLDLNHFSVLLNNFQCLTDGGIPEDKEMAMGSVFLDNELHSAIIRSSKNDYLIEMMNHYLDLLSLIRMTTTLRSARAVSSNQEHFQIVQAIVKHDISKACLLLKEHLVASYKDTVFHYIPQL